MPSQTHCNTLYAIFIYYEKVSGNWNHLKSERELHYKNMPMQSTEIFSVLKFENFVGKFMIFFLFFAQNIDCEYPQSMFWGKNKKNRYTPAYPSFTT